MCLIIALLKRKTWLAFIAAHVSKTTEAGCHLKLTEHLESLWFPYFGSSIAPSPSWGEFNQSVINQNNVSPNSDVVVLRFINLNSLTKVDLSLSPASKHVHPVESWR